MNNLNPEAERPGSFVPPSQIPISPSTEPVDKKGVEELASRAIPKEDGLKPSEQSLTERVANQLRGGLLPSLDTLPGNPELAENKQKQEMAAWAAQDIPLGEAPGEKERDTTAQPTISIPESNPFFSKGVIVFSDDYEEDMPYLNAMRESEWKEASQLIEQLRSAVPEQDKVSGLEYIQVKSLRITGDAGFRARITDLILTLCVRSASRELISLMTKMRDFVTIREDDSVPGMFASYEGVRMNPYLDAELNIQRPDGKTERQILPHELVLAHELIHVLHLREPEGIPLPFQDRVDDRWTNIEERRTITGWTEFPVEEAVASEAVIDVLEEGEIWDFDAVQSDWSLFSENGIRMLFNLPPRADHYGAFSIRSGTPAEIAAQFEDIEDQRFIELVTEEAEKGNLVEAVRLLKSHLEISKRYPEIIDYIISLAVRLDNVQAARELLTLFGYRTDWGDHVAKAFEQGKVEWVEMWAEVPMLKLTSDQSSIVMDLFRDRISKGTSLPQDREMLRMLLDKGVLDIDAPLGSGVAPDLRGHTLYGSFLVCNFARDFDRDIADLIMSRTTLNVVDWYFMALRNKDAGDMNLMELLGHPDPKIPEGMEHIIGLRSYLRAKEAAGEAGKPPTEAIRVVMHNGHLTIQMQQKVRENLLRFLRMRQYG